MSDGYFLCNVKTLQYYGLNFPRSKFFKSEQTHFDYFTVPTLVLLKKRSVAC